ncbi:lipoprotein [Spiroplasma tabanidicola]|uniref:Lipoprotein n=1 Tax=Spiroplasma tabanidicola TaxID=324079 RepID=A0A6I6CCR1_9MOLU|nr:lipoprotein [Spiroplasma tabanidicola]QGS52078.1 hypothetical protein STABA_v1c07220 [Spiroplasma tabanidicola]
MKKLLTLLASIGLVSTASTAIIACNNTTQDVITDLNKISNKDLKTLVGKDQTPSLESIVQAINWYNDNISLTVDEVEFSGEPTTSKATIKAKDDAKIFKGKVNVTYNYSVGNAFSISIFEDAINNVGFGASLRPNSYNSGFLMSSNLQNRLVVKDSLKKFVVELAKKASSYVAFTADQIMDMIDINYRDGQNKSIIETDKETKIEKLYITVKDGHQNDIKNYISYGVAKINLKEQIDLKTAATQKDLGKITFINMDYEEDQKSKIIVEFMNKNSNITVDNASQFSISNYNLKGGFATINNGFNGSYTNEVTVKFIADIQNNENIQNWDLSIMSNSPNSEEWTDWSFFDAMKLKKDPNSSALNDDELTTLINYIMSLEDSEPYSMYWIQFNEGKKYFLDTQGSGEEQGKVKFSDFKNDFLSIFDVTVNTNDVPSENEGPFDATGSITIEVKKGQENKYLDKGYILSGKLKTWYSV